MTAPRIPLALGLFAAAACVEIPEPASFDAVPAVVSSDAAVDVGVDVAADAGRADGPRPLPPPDEGVDGPPFAPTDARAPLDRDVEPRDAEPRDAAVADAADVGFGGVLCPDGARAVPGLRVCLRFDMCPALPEARVGHRIVALDSGKALLAGGGPEMPPGTALSEMTYTFDGAAWAEAGGLGDGGRHRHTLNALPGDRAILVSGDQGPDEPVDNLQSETLIYHGSLAEPGRRGWREDDDVPRRRGRHAAIWLGDRLLISGGVAGRPIDSDNIGEPATWMSDDGWSDPEIGEPPVFDHRIVEAGAQVVLIGGQVASDNGNDEVRPNDVALAWRGGAWEPIARDVTHGGGPVVGTPDGVLLVGGAVARRGAELRRLRAAGIEALAQMAVVRDGAAAARVGPLVVILGGELAGAPDSTIDVVDVGSGRHGATRLADDTIGRWTEAQTVTLADGSALVVGGLADGVPTDRCLRISLSP